jgi:hypothetical protein
VEKLHQLALLLDRYFEVALLQHVFISLVGLRQLGIAEFRGLFVFLEAHRNHDQAQGPSLTGIGNGLIHRELHLRRPPLESLRRHLACHQVTVRLPVILTGHLDAVDLGHQRDVGGLLHQLLRNGKVHFQKSGLGSRRRIERESERGRGPSP